MNYHDNCKGREAREYGWPIKCIQLFSDGWGEYECPACGQLWNVHEDSPEPKGWRVE